MVSKYPNRRTSRFRFFVRSEVQKNLYWQLECWCFDYNSETRISHRLVRVFKKLRSEKDYRKEI